jgi:transposase
MHRHELSDAQWAKVVCLLPLTRGPRSKRGDRVFVNAVMWRLKTGAPWRDIPERYGSWKTTYNRFARWAKRGVWEHVFKELRIEDDVGSLIDGSVVRAHQDAAGGKGGSDAMLWAVLEEVFPPKSTRSRRPRANRSTSR